jgi:hypothetical protein
MNYIDTLKKKRELRVFYPDISVEEALKNEPYLMRVKLPIIYKFLQVLQIQDPLAGLGVPGVGMSSKLAYAFLVDPEEELEARFYLTSLMPDIPFPWHDDDGPYDDGIFPAVTCRTLGITTHNGVPILHVSTLVGLDDYEDFEEEVQKVGYRLVDGARYKDGAALHNLYKSNASKIREHLAQQVQPPRQGVAEPNPKGPEGGPEPAGAA